jgi:hypothetical protein
MCTGNAVAWWWAVLLRLAYLGVTNVFALLRLLPMSSRDKDAEILALRRPLSVLQRQLGPTGCGSPRPTGPCWPRCCTGSLGRYSIGCT